MHRELRRPPCCHGRVMGENGLASGENDRGSRVFGNAQESLRRLWQAEEQLIGTGIPEGFDQRCVVEFLAATGTEPG